ncbi:MAG: SAF domain-containing protein [Candidatus Dormibacteria bacterium]
MLPTPFTDTTRGRTAARITPRPWRPRPSLLVVGLVLVLASVVGVGALIHSVSGEHGILVMSQTVQAGQVITAGDVEVVNVSEDMGNLTVIDSSQEAAVVGRPAATTLYDGTPVVVSELGPVQLPTGESVMAVNAKLGSYPPSIAAGDEVEVIDTQTASGSTPSPAPVATAPVDAAVVAVDDVDGVISLQLPSGEAATLAPAAASGNLVLLLVSGGGS